MTRESEIEALAMQIHAQWTIEFNQRTGDWPEGENRDAMFEDHISTAMGVVAARDRWRAARQPAPEKKNDFSRAEWLRIWLECCAALGLRAYAGVVGEPFAEAVVSGQVILACSKDELDALRQHAATLKEKP